MPPPGRGTEARTGNGEEHRRVEVKKFSLQPEKYDRKVDFEGWVNQFQEYAMLGQWSEEERALLLFLSLTGRATDGRHLRHRRWTRGWWWCIRPWPRVVQCPLCQAGTFGLRNQTRCRPDPWRDDGLRKRDDGV